MFSICIDRSLLTSFITSDANWDPKSVSISDGKPNLVNMLNNASATRSASMHDNGIASGY